MVALGETLVREDRGRLMAALRKMGVTLCSGRIPEAARQPALQPTVFIPTRRGQDVTWQDVVARRV